VTDHELLELAAKAAGIKIVGPVERFIAQPPREHVNGFIIENDNGGHSSWNPLADDGDALRLAVKCLPFHVLKYAPQDYELCNKDGLAATRRAIVRAAAEIGRGMP
jgi:hypothetical protein